MQREAPRSLGDRVADILEQLLQHLSDSSSDSEDDNAETELLIDVRVLDPTYAGDADVRVYDAELPQVAPEKSPARGRRRITGNRRALIQEKRSFSDDALCRFRSRSPLRVRDRTP